MAADKNKKGLVGGWRKNVVRYREVGDKFLFCDLAAQADTGVNPNEVIFC